MRKTEANKEVLSFVLEHGIDKVDNLSLWDYVRDWESLKNQMPLTYARIQKEVNKEVKNQPLVVIEDIDFLMGEKFEDLIREASISLHKMIWG